MDSKNFPQYVILNDEVSREVKRLSVMLNKAVQGYDCLMNMSDYAMPEDLADVTVENLEKMVKEKLVAVESSAYLTADNKKSIVKDWQNFKAEASTCINDIRAIVDELPDVKFTTSTGTLRCEDSLRTIAEAKCRKQVPADAKTHYTLMQDVLARIEVLRQWEKKHDCKSEPFRTLIMKSAEDVATAWVTGTVKIDREHEDPFAIAFRMSNNSLIL